MTLRHADPDCAGEWRLSGAAMLVCTRCRAVMPATPENRRAAADENSLAAMLRRLTRDGERILRREQ